MMLLNMLTTIIKKTLVFSLAVVGLVVAVPAHAQSGVTVTFETTPLFSQGDFMPGDSVSRWVDVDNASDSNQAMAVKVNSYSDPDDLGDHIEITITEGSATRFAGTLQALFDASQADGYFLSNVASGDSTRYNVSAAFPAATGSAYQQTSVSFDITIGTQTSGGPPNPGGGVRGSGGGGGGLRFVPPPSTTHPPLPSGEGDVLGQQTGEPAATLEKTSALGFANPGSFVTYTLTVTNTGDAALENVVVLDELPEFFSFMNGSRTRRWMLGTIAPKKSETVTYRVNVASSAPVGEYTNTATLTADNYHTLTASVAIDVYNGQVLGTQEEGEVDGERLPESGFNWSEAGLIIGMMSLAWVGKRGLQRQYAGE